MYDFNTHKWSNETKKYGKNYFQYCFPPVGNEGKAQEITEQTRSSQGDVVMFAGCKDYQTSADTSVQGYGATGAARYGFT